MWDSAARGKNRVHVLWPRDLLDLVCHIRRGLWGAGADSWGVLSTLREGGSLLAGQGQAAGGCRADSPRGGEAGSGSWGAATWVELVPVAVAQWVIC